MTVTLQIETKSVALQFSQLLVCAIKPIAKQQAIEENKVGVDFGLITYSPAKSDIEHYNSIKHILLLSRQAAEIDLSKPYEHWRKYEDWHQYDDWRRLVDDEKDMMAPKNISDLDLR